MTVTLGVVDLRAESQPLRIATFQVDATPPIGSALCDGLVVPAKTIDDRLSGRGLVFLGTDKPIVLFVLDWVGVGNGGQDAWRQALAQAAGTTPDRVAIHSTHAHDAPGCDFDAEALLAARGLSGAAFDPKFARSVIASAAAALKQSLQNPQPVTHLGTGRARVERVASSRRVLGPDGKVKWVRWSATRDPEARDQPEGVIDPYVHLVSLWNGDKPLAVLSYYACHPQSHYGQGAVSCDVPGLARNRREKALGVPCLHFQGAAGNVTAGKYNDGDPANRAELTGRLADGMARAWESTVKVPISAADVCWRVQSRALPVSAYLDETKLLAQLDNPQQPVLARVNAARDLAWLQRCKSGQKVDLTCLAVGSARILHMPGELFVEYQLAAQKMRPDLFVAMAAYGEYGTGYIGTQISYSQGGYEVGPGISLVDETVEQVLMSAVKELLD